MKAKVNKHRINNEINKLNVKIRIVGGDDVDSSKLITFAEAIAIAESKDVDLIETGFNNGVSVCRLAEYGKFLYQQDKKDKEQAKKQKETSKELKEIRFTSNTDDNDVLTKRNKIEEFLTKGHKVKLVVRFKGRNITYKERGEIILLKLAAELEAISKPDALPKLIGKDMSMILSPKK